MKIQHLMLLVGLSLPTVAAVGAVSGADQTFNPGFVQVPIPGLPTAYAGTSVAWGDYDNDGRLDFLITGLVGYGGGGPYVSQLCDGRILASGFASGLRGSLIEK